MATTHSAAVLVSAALVGVMVARGQVRGPETPRSATLEDVPGEVLVLDSLDQVDAWTDQVLGQGPDRATALGNEAALVREGRGAGRWGCLGKRRERFGMDVVGAKSDWSGYDQVQLWCYAAKRTVASVQPLVTWAEGESRAPLKIDWVGWRLLTIPKSRFAGRGEPDWSHITGFGFEEHTYYHMGFYPLTDTELVVDGVVLTKKIIEGSLRNGKGSQAAADGIVYTVRIRNLSDRERICSMSAEQSRDGELVDEVGIAVTPPQLTVPPRGELTAAVTFTVPARLMAQPRSLRTRLPLSTPAFSSLHRTSKESRNGSGRMNAPETCGKPCATGLTRHLPTPCRCGAISVACSIRCSNWHSATR